MVINIQISSASRLLLAWTKLDELLTESAVVFVDSIDHVSKIVQQNISRLEGFNGRAKKGN
jgi:hypothetical protein